MRIHLLPDLILDKVCIRGNDESVKLYKLPTYLSCWLYDYRYFKSCKVSCVHTLKRFRKPPKCKYKHVLFYCTYKYCIFHKRRVCSNPASNKTINAIFPTAWNRTTAGIKPSWIFTKVPHRPGNEFQSLSAKFYHTESEKKGKLLLNS